MAKRYSDAYRFTTTDRNDPKIVALKKEMRELTLKDRASGALKSNESHRVYLRGRLGKNNPAAEWYAVGNRKQIIQLSDAARFDVYVTKEYRSSRKKEPDYTTIHAYQPSPHDVFISTFPSALREFIDNHMKACGITYLADYQARPVIVRTLAQEIITRS